MVVAAASCRLTLKPLSLLIILMVVILLYFPCSSSSTRLIGTTSSPDVVESECLKVPASEFLNSVKTTIEAVQQVTSIISQFANLVGDFRLSSAISDCLDLLDFSAEELYWSLATIHNPKGKNNSTGNESADLKTWLSAAMVNPETCMDGFEGTSSIVKGVVSGSIDQVTSLVRGLLAMVDSSSYDNNNNEKKNVDRGNHKAGGDDGQFPSWVGPEERKLLQEANGIDGHISVDVIVAANGSGNFTRVMDAVLTAPDYSMRRYVIYIKKGVYLENVEIKKKKWNLMMIGDGMDLTLISSNRSFVDGWTTFRSATFAVRGRGFIARDMTIENNAGPEKHQAVALRSDSDLSVFFRCSIRGYQDTLYSHTMRQFYRECQISGTVDFIFGDATVVFQNCQILARKGLPNQKNTITAQGRKDPIQPTGFSIQFCNISADSDLQPLVNSTPTYLGRPWKPYSRTIIMQSYMSNAIRPQGWLEWKGDFALNTLFYGEYQNYGPGSGLADRVKWPGYHVLNQSSQATNFTVAQFIEGNLWLPSTGVKYTAGFVA